MIIHRNASPENNKSTADLLLIDEIAVGKPRDDASLEKRVFGKHMLNILHVRMNFRSSFTLWILHIVTPRSPIGYCT